MLAAGSWRCASCAFESPSREAVRVHAGGCSGRGQHGPHGGGGGGKRRRSEAQPAATAPVVLPAPDLPDPFDYTYDPKDETARFTKDQLSDLQQRAAQYFFGGRSEPACVYDVILADPPWQYAGAKGREGWAAQQYRCMSNEELWAMPVAGLAAPAGCYLLLWTTGPKIREGLETLKRWGFSYVTFFFVYLKVDAKDKPRTCMSSYTNPSTEFCLLGTRGRTMALKARNDIKQLLAERPPGHSRKPREAVRRIESFFRPDVRKIELFARRRRRGWDVWGLEVAEGDEEEEDDDEAEEEERRGK